MKPEDQNPELQLILNNADLKAKLEKLASQDFDRFLAMMDLGALQVYICAEAEKELSYGTIANRLRAHGVTISRQSVGERCRKCKDTPYK